MIKSIKKRLEIDSESYGKIVLKENAEKTGEDTEETRVA